MSENIEHQQSEQRRTSNMMAVDTFAILNTIKELELKLAEHHRQDVLLSSVTTRLDMLEKERAQAEGRLYREPSLEYDIDQSSEDRIMKKLQTSMDLMSERYNMTLESKLSSISFELDRVHKLLSVRPTTSDLSKVVLTVQDMKSDMQRSIHEQGQLVEAHVKDTVAEEMSFLIEHMKNSGDMGVKGLDGLLKQIDMMSSEIYKLRAATNTETKNISKTVSTQDQHLNEVEEKLNQFKAEFDDGIFSKTAFIDVQARGISMEHQLSDIRKELLQLSTTQNDKILSNEISIESVSHQVQRMELNYNGRLDEGVTQMNELTEKVSTIEGEFLDRFETSQRDIEDVTSRFNKYSELLQHLKAADVVKAINKHTSQLSIQEQHISEAADLHASFLLRFRTLETALQNAEKEREQLREQINVTNQNVATTIENAIRKSEYDMQVKLDNLLAYMHQQSADVQDAKNLMSELQSSLLTVDQKVKMVKQELISLVEKSDEFQNTTSAALLNSATIQSKCVADLAVLAPQMEHVTAKTRATALSLEKAEENIERVERGIAEAAAERQKQGVFGAGKRTSFMPAATASAVAGASTGRGAQQRKSSLRPKLSDDRRSGRQGGDVRTQRVNLKRVSILASTNEDPAFPSSPAGPETKVSFDANEPPSDDVYFDELPDFGDQQEEFEEEILSQAQYTAELCATYEESSVKQSRVLEIPKAICEHLTQTAQALTSFASTTADAEVVLRVLRASPADVTYDEESVNRLRQEKIDNFVQDVLSHLHSLVPREAGIIRYEAREKYIKKLHTALTLCMTKHDQVLVAGHTRIGRIKIPSCIACDRPLVSKVARDQYIDLPSAARPLTSTSDRRPKTVEKPKILPAMSPKPESKGGIQGRAVSLQVNPVLSLSASAEEPYVLRAGFKMPTSAVAGKILGTGAKDPLELRGGATLE